MEFKDIPIIHAERAIPKGAYCYSVKKIHESIDCVEVNPCMFWDLDSSKPSQMNGYCSYLRRGDWETGLSLLWDQVKECGIKAMYLE